MRTKERGRGMNSSANLFSFRRVGIRAVEGYRSPSRFAVSGAWENAPASWSAPVLWRFGGGEATTNSARGLAHSKTLRSYEQFIVAESRSKEGVK